VDRIVCAHRAAVVGAKEKANRTAKIATVRCYSSPCVVRGADRRVRGRRARVNNKYGFRDTLWDVSDYCDDYLWRSDALYDGDVDRPVIS
jgi:hypothetical protein